MTHDLLAASSSPSGRSTDWRMRDNATTRRERNDTSQQTMAPTEETSTAPAQKQKNLCQPRAHAVLERLNNSRKIADRRNKSPTAPAETTQAIRSPAEVTKTNKAHNLKQKRTQTAPNDIAEHAKIEQHWRHQHDRRHRHNKSQNSGNNTGQQEKQNTQPQTKHNQDA